MTSALIVSTARTPLAKSWKGAFNMTHGATLGGHAVQHAIARAGIDAGEVDDVIMGCANPEGATGANIGRQIALMAGCPVTTSGMTVNRFCSSGLQTIALAAIAAEDQTFPDHSGFDWQSIKKAMKYNEENENKRRGASTISQQVAKNVFLWQGGGFFRKGLEVYFTFMIELISWYK